MASVFNTITFHPDAFHPSDTFHSSAMSSFPPPPGRHAQHEDVSRESPSRSANAPPQPVNLPPLSSIHPRQQRPSHSPLPAEAQSQSQQSGLSGPIPPYGTLPPSMSQYYGSQLNTSGQYVGGSPAPTAVALTSSRFLIAPTSDPNSMISGSRHKKEVKKRTKTGCMTCRKRRIKCDEGHPACRNCVKSKRECLGYDPIFKSQSPSSIQPAPHLRSPVSSNAASHLHSPSYTSTPHLIRPESYAKQDSPASVDQSDFSPRAHNHLCRSDSITTSTSTMDDSNAKYDLREHSRPEDQTIRKATQKIIDDLCWIDDHVGTSVSASAHRESQDSNALRTIYNISFAPGLSRLLESHWFSADGGMTLASDRALLTQFENYVAAISNSPSVANQEARLVWALLCMCRRRPLPGFAGEFINGPEFIPDKGNTLDAVEVAEARLDIVEALITVQQLASNPLAGRAEPALNSTSPTLTQQLQAREQDFWLQVGAFVSTSDPDVVERILSKCRKLLDNFENRDVIYSIMLMRHIGEKWNEKQIEDAQDERDKKDWLAAKGFLEKEAGGQAMNVVIKRFCAMALRAWST